MILNITHKLPDYALQAIEKCDFVDGVRRCIVLIQKEDAATYIHPENFDFAEVFGKCEVVQTNNGTTPWISRYEFENNHRSFEHEAATQLDEKLNQVV